jgi:hypothetical protein
MTPDKGINGLVRHTLVLAALALATSALALGGNECSLTSLRGSYIFAANGYNIVAGVAQPKTIVEPIDFKGDGTISVPAATRSINGIIGRTPPGGTGTYTVEAGCKGSITFTGGPSFDIFISPSGDKLWMIQTNPDTVFQGTATRISQRTGIHDATN